MSIPVITSSRYATANVGQAFSYQIVASGTPTGYSVANLPAGVDVNTSTGLVSGTPTSVGGFFVIVTATNDFGSASAQVILNVFPPPIPPTANVPTNPNEFGTAARKDVGTGQGNIPLNSYLFSSTGVLAAFDGHNLTHVAAPAGLRGLDVGSNDIIWLDANGNGGNHSILTGANTTGDFAVGNGGAGAYDVTYILTGPNQLNGTLQVPTIDYGSPYLGESLELLYQIASGAATLGGLNVNGPITLQGDTVEIDEDGNITANSFAGDGSSLLGLTASQFNVTPVTNGTYTVGLGVTTNGTLTIINGFITAVQEAS